MVAGIRTHWDGLFQFGAPDGVVVNVTKEAIWTRKAALPESTNFARPSGKEALELFDISLTKTTVNFPDPKNTLADIEDPAARSVEYDAKLYYPPDVYRKPNPIFPKGFKIDIKKMLKDKIVQKIKSTFGNDE
jgi:ribonuclease Z